MQAYVEAAARNNAAWCDAVCRSHGLRTRLGASVWTSERRSPPAYPDAVTLAASVGAEDVLGLVDNSAGCSVKDSFASLDLAPAGFRILFEARWIRHPPVPAGAPGWRVVRTPAQLRAWGAAHGGGDVFRPSLLADPGITVLAACEDDRIVGGAIANRGSGVAGLSNVFAVGDPGAIWAAAAGEVSAHHPGMTVVGYESGTDLDLARGAGFVDSGPLRVWLRD